MAKKKTETKPSEVVGQKSNEVKTKIPPGGGRKIESSKDEVSTKILFSKDTNELEMFVSKEILKHKAMGFNLLGSSYSYNDTGYGRTVSAMLIFEKVG